MRLARKLGEILTEFGLVTPDQLKDALEAQAQSKERLGKVLVKLGYITEENIAQALEKQLYIPYVDLQVVPLEANLMELIPREIMERDQVIPIKREGNRLQLGMVDPLNPTIIDTVRRLTGCSVEPVIVTESAFIQTLQNPQRNARQTAKSALDSMKGEISRRVSQEEAVVDITARTDQAKDEAHAVIRLVDSILNQAVNEKASDIHIEPLAKQVRIRYRIDGILYESMTLPKEIHSDITTRIKVIAHMDIAEHRLPQDGHIAVKSNGREFDLRVSTLPSAQGEKVVIRLLDKQAPLLGLENLRFSGDNLSLIKRLTQKSYGILLTAGPTGSGKTTTLYCILNEINKSTRNIVTIEDPIEYQFESITQTQVNTKSGYVFAEGLRSILRQDPDIIMVGEIRDRETLETAIQASMTGHLVLSTIHTNDSLTAITRMVDLGVTLQSIMLGLMGVVAQRLVRRLCPNCRVPYSSTSDKLLEQGFEIAKGQEVKLFSAKGCSSCNNRGYRGRLGLQEILVIDNQTAEMYLRNEPLPVIQFTLRKRGMKFLANDGLEKSLAGETTIEEVLRVV